MLQPRKGNNADGDGFNAPEAYTEEAFLVSFPRVCRGPLESVVCVERSVRNLGDLMDSWSQLGQPKGRPMVHGESDHLVVL